MEKITSILAVVEESASGAVVLDKALALARRFHAKVQLLVADSLLTPEFASRCAALAYDEVTLSSLFRSGEPLLRRLHERLPDMLIKAPAGKQAPHRGSLHDNDRELASDSPVPVLLAGPKPWADPLRFAAAVDVSDAETSVVARGVLHTAGFLALGSHGNLDILYSEREERDETLRMERAVRLAQLVREFHVGCERLQMFGGAPESRLPPLIAARQYDVLVLGAVSHREGSALSSRNLTSILAEATDGDVVLVKPGTLARAAVRAGTRSIFEKLAHQCEELV